MEYGFTTAAYVVGNLTAGGNGKTPVVIWLAEQLQRRGIRPGVVSRGYGGKAAQYPLVLSPATTTAEAGDEPVLIYQRTGAPVAVSPVRSDAVKALLDADQIVIAAGGGGIPVLQQGTHLKGASAIIEKDYTAAKLAELVNAQTLLFLTAYDNLTIEKGTPNEKVFEQVSASDLHTYIKAGHFPAKTTFPKVDASIRFVTADSERKAVISNLDKAKSSLAGKTGTTITA